MGEGRWSVVCLFVYRRISNGRRLLKDAEPKANRRVLFSIRSLPFRLPFVRRSKVDLGA